MCSFLPFCTHGETVVHPNGIAQAEVRVVPYRQAISCARISPNFKRASFHSSSYISKRPGCTASVRSVRIQLLPP